MIGGDEIDDVISQSVPELFAVFFFANGRSAFEFGSAIGNVFGGKRQIVRAGLHGDARASGFRFAQGRKGIRRNEMHDVDAHLELIGQTD